MRRLMTGRSEENSGHSEETMRDANTGKHRITSGIMTNEQQGPSDAKHSEMQSKERSEQFEKVPDTERIWLGS